MCFCRCSVGVCITKSGESRKECKGAVAQKDKRGRACDCKRVVQVHCCFKSTETVRTVRDGVPRTSISTFTQLLSSAETVQVQRQCCFSSTETVIDYWGRGAQDVHLDFHTDLEL